MEMKFLKQSTYIRYVIPMLSNKCFILGHLMISWYMNTWKVKIWLSHEQKELLKLTKNIFLVSQVLSFTDTKQTSKNVADTTIYKLIAHIKTLWFITFLLSIQYAKHPSAQTGAS